MTVAELIKELKKLDKDAIVVMSSDGEGNKFSPLADYGTGLYIPDCTCSGEVMNDDEEEFEVPADAVKCIVLYPTN